MFRRIIVVLVLLAIVGGAAFWWLTTPTKLAAEELPQHTPDLANGEFMFKIGGCAPCHAAGSITDGRERVTAREMAGGWPIESPFGTFYTPNISPDPEHGIGRWSTVDFVNAMKFGVDPEGAHLYPAFPYYSYQRMKVEDLIDLKAYLDTLPKVATSPPPHAVGFPFNIRRGIGLWKLLYVDGHDFAADPAATAEVNRGAYLVEGPGHCGECHTPRNLVMGLVESRRLSGGPPLEKGVRAPNLTPDRDTGIGKYSVDDFMLNLMMLGVGLDGRDPPGRGGMRSVLIELQGLPAAEQQAIITYLKTVPPISTPDAKDEAAAAETPAVTPAAATTLTPAAVPPVTLGPSPVLSPAAIPQITIPQFTIPQIAIPQIAVPQVAVPQVAPPAVAVPPVAVPPVTPPPATPPAAN